MATAPNGTQPPATGFQRGTRTAQARNQEGGLRTSTTYKRNTYEASGLVYPADLHDFPSPYGNNWVAFYLNVHEDSKQLTVDKVDTVPPEQVEQRMNGNAANVSTAGVVGTSAIAGAAATNAANVAGRTSSALGVPMNQGAATAVNTAVGGAVGAGVAAYAGGSKRYKRLKQVIALNIPTDLAIRYSMDWQQDDLAGSLAMASAIEAMGPALIAAGVAGGVTAALTKGSKVKTAAAAAGAGLVVGAATGGLGTAAKNLAAYGTGLALQTPGAGALLSKAAGIAANPKKEQIFKSVDFRTFTFSYQFFPRNQKEVDNVDAIISAFKFHMHPEYRDEGQFLYILPSEFDIYYYNKDKENLYIHRHTSCVLTDMSVSYAPQGVFATFDNGMPTQINIQLTFKELATLSKETIADGY